MYLGQTLFVELERVGFVCNFKWFDSNLQDEKWLAFPALSITIFFTIFFLVSRSILFLFIFIFFFFIGSDNFVIGLLKLGLQILVIDLTNHALSHLVSCRFIVLVGLNHGYYRMIAKIFLGVVILPTLSNIYDPDMELLGAILKIVSIS